MYSLKRGDRRPGKTSAGWHFVKILDTRTARGEMEIAQILVRITKDFDEGFAKDRIDSIYAMLQKGGDFAEIARKYSGDLASAPKGGFWASSLSVSMTMLLRIRYLL